MNFQVNDQLLRQYFSGYEIDFGFVADHLDLDLGHVLLLRDCLVDWGNTDAIVLVVLLYLTHEINQGSLCLDLQDKSFQNYLTDIGYKDAEMLFTADWSRFKLEGESALIKSGNYLYFNKYFQFEKQLELALTGLLNNYSGPVFSAKQVNQTALKVVDDLAFDVIEDQQVLAVLTSLLQPFSLISGGPGTGKTTIMGSVLRALVSLGYKPKDIVLAAPTGRAANRMTESLHDLITNNIKQINLLDQELLQLEAVTLHRLLGANPQRGGFSYGAHNQLPCHLLVVDEVSMVDIKLMKQLFQALKHGCRVILLGDQFQLPSVDSGAVLADLMPPVAYSTEISKSMGEQLAVALSGFVAKDKLLTQLVRTNDKHLLTDCVTVLNVSKRSRKNISEISEYIKLGVAEEVFNSPNWQQYDLSKQLTKTNNDSGVYHLNPFLEQQHWFQYCLRWITQHYFATEKHFVSHIKALVGFDEENIGIYCDHLDAVFKTVNSNRILTLVNESQLGNRVINEQICDMMRLKLGVSGFKQQFHGSVVMLQRNDKTLNIFNGDVGLLLQAKNGQLRAVLPHKSGYRSHSVHVIPEYTSAYAMTVHKSQGSEFEHVLLVLPDDPAHRLLSREIIYTGVTRAKESVVVYANQKALVAAIERLTKRKSGLNFW